MLREHRADMLRMRPKRQRTMHDRFQPVRIDQSPSYEELNSADVPVATLKYNVTPISQPGSGRGQDLQPYSVCAQYVVPLHLSESVLVRLGIDTADFASSYHVRNGTWRSRYVCFL